MDPSTNGCDILDPKPVMKIALLAWLQIDFAPVFRWRHRYGAAIDDTTRIYRYWIVKEEVIGIFRLRQCNIYGPQHQWVQYF